MTTGFFAGALSYRTPKLVKKNGQIEEWKSKNTALSYGIFGAGYRSRTFSGSNPPTANFFRLLCSVYLPQKVRGIFGLKTQKTGLGMAMIAIPKPVFTYFTVFRAVFALKARKLPDLSGRQIRQLLCVITTALIQFNFPSAFEPTGFINRFIWTHLSNTAETRHFRHFSEEQSRAGMP